MAFLIPATFSFLDGIGLFMAGVGLYGFAQNNFYQKQHDGATVRFGLGLDGAGPYNAPLRGAEGQLPAIHLWNEKGIPIGSINNHKTFCRDGGAPCDSTVPDATQQAPYTLFEANDDGICVAWMTMTYSDGSHFAWTGNFAWFCGQPWYYSDIQLQNNRGEQFVKCAWMDGNGDSPTRGIQVYWPDYSRDFTGHNDDPHYYCNSPHTLTFHRDESPKDVITKESEYYQAHHPSKRSNESEPRPLPETWPFKERMAQDTRLIKSKHADHSATRLCEDKASLGPSFVSYDERKFCHMAPKRLYSFCEDVKSGDCWDDNKHEIVHKGAKGVVKRAANPAVAFNKVLRWGEGAGQNQV
ncbi:hypothetical protein E4U53_006443 [Claviceps sorghi]|nr:hypothetical protein E4U53_006443 [Claviceps sorghi]